MPTIPATDIYALTDSGQCLGRSTVEVVRAMMQAIAAEIHLSETAFVLRPTTPDADIRIRWFTPAVEACGVAPDAAARDGNGAGPKPDRS